MSTTSWVAIYLMVALLMGIATGCISMSIGISRHRTAGWFWAGFFFEFIGIFWAFAMPVLTPGDEGYTASARTKGLRVYSVR